MIKISWKTGPRMTFTVEWGLSRPSWGIFFRGQLSFLGHVLRKEELEKLVMTGFVDGKRARSRQRDTYLTYLGKMKQKLPMELLKWLRIEVFDQSCMYMLMLMSVQLRLIGSQAITG